MVINTPKSLSITAALHPDVSVALDAAQADAAAEIHRFLALHSVTRVGPRGRQEVVPVERLQTVAVVHKTSRAGDPHRHVHFQIGTRVWAAAKWRGRDTAALFKQQGAIRALGTAVLAAHPGLADALVRQGLTLDPVTGEVTELEQFNALMSKRAAQVEKNLAEAEASWDQTHHDHEPGPAVHARMVAKAWAKDRPQKRPTNLASEEGWRQELADAGYDPVRLAQRRLPEHPPVDLDDLEIQAIASRALDRCAAAASTWTPHTVREQVTRIITEYGARAEPADLRQLIEITTNLAVGDCLSVLPPDAPQPEHVAHLTSVGVVAAETNLRDLLTAAIETSSRDGDLDVTALEEARDLDDAQARTAAAIASTDPLVIVEGAAGAGKTTMLGAAIAAAAADGRAMRIVTPTKRAADVAARELGVPAESVAKLLHAHGWRWNSDGVWTRTEAEAPAWARLARGERIVVDEAGMLDQDAAFALLVLAAEAGATVALVGDRAQLPAVGRGGVLDIAAEIAAGSGATVHDLDTVHRFADPAYADLTVALRAASGPSQLFDRLAALGLVQTHDTEDDAHAHIAAATAAAIGAGAAVAATAATNDEAQALNDRVRARRVAAGEVDDTATATGRDGLAIGAGDVIATRRNDSALGVANRQTWTVQAVGRDGTVVAVDNSGGRRRGRVVAVPAGYVAEHVHLAYAATGYGVQGATTATAHTMLSEAMDAAGVYVGMTRGRDRNVLHIVAADLDEARERFVDAMQRDRADRGLDAAAADAESAVAGLTAEGPVKLVNDERARLAREIEQAEQQSARWARAATSIANQTRAHDQEEGAARRALATAEACLTNLRDKTIAPLRARAEADGHTFIDADAREHEARQDARSAGRLARRGAERRLAAAQADASAAGNAVRTRWGSVPGTGRWGIQTDDSVDDWAERVAAERADAEPPVADAQRQARSAREALTQTRAHHREEAQALTVQIFGPHDAMRHRAHTGPNGAEGRAQRWQEYADAARATLTRLESLPTGRAVQFIETRRAQAAQVEVNPGGARRTRLVATTQHRLEPPDPGLNISM